MTDKTALAYSIPHANSKAIQMVAVAQSLPLAGGQFVWDGQWTPCTPARSLRRGQLYVVRSYGFSADVSELDWQANFIEAPQIQFGTTNNGLAPLFRDPLVLLKYTDSSEFIESWIVSGTPSELRFRVTGSIGASLALAGKTSIRAIVTLLAYEISDDSFIKIWKEQWDARK